MDQENELLQTEDIINTSTDKNPIPQTQDIPEENRETIPQSEDNIVLSSDEKDTLAADAFIESETEDIFQPFQQKETSVHIAAPEEEHSYIASPSPERQQRNPYGAGVSGQQTYGMPQDPAPIMGDGNNYIPLRRENVYRPTNQANDAYPTPNGYSAPIRDNRTNGYDYVPNGRYSQTAQHPQVGQYPHPGQYARSGQYPSVGNYPPAGAGIPSEAYYPGGNYAPERANQTHGAAMLPMPKEKKNHKPVISLIFGLLAMGVLNFFPFIALVLGVIALCTGYIGLKKGELTTGQRVCGFIGLGLGIISLIISISMLIMLLSLSIRAAAAAAETQGSIYR